LQGKIAQPAIGGDEMKTARWKVCVICLALALHRLSPQADAAGVVLSSNSFAKICRVEVSKGANADRSRNQVVFEGPIEKGWRYETHDADTLCYRRSKDPSNCWSDLTERRCIRWTMDGQINLPLQ
jgi:hypothetical protein